jgi:hypothetical protein
MPLTLIKTNQIPKPTLMRGRAKSELRTIEEFETAIDALVKDKVEPGESIDITLGKDALKKYGEVKNLENRLVQLFLSEIKRHKLPFKVRKLTIKKGERPHIFLVRTSQVEIEPEQTKDELFERTLHNTSDGNRKMKHRSAAA